MLFPNDYEKYKQSSFLHFKEYITKQKYTKYIVVEVEKHTYGYYYYIFQTKVI